jgi:hypothetical protein
MRIRDLFKRESQKSAPSEAKTLFTNYLQEFSQLDFKWRAKPAETESGRRILESQPERQAEIAKAAMEHLLRIYKWDHSFPFSRIPYALLTHSYESTAAEKISSQLLRRKLPFEETDLQGLLRISTKLNERSHYYGLLASVLKALERHTKSTSLSKPLETLLKEARVTIEDGWALSSADKCKLQSRIDDLVGKRIRILIDPGEVWSDAVVRDLGEMQEDEWKIWTSLLLHGQSAQSSKPSRHWLKTAEKCLNELPEGVFAKRCQAWFELVGKQRKTGVEDANRGREATRKILDGGIKEFTEVAVDLGGNIVKELAKDAINRVRGSETQPVESPLVNRVTLLNEANSNLLKGLVWCCAVSDDEELIRSVSNLAVVCYRKIPDYGAISVKVGNACIQSLSLAPGLEGVSRLQYLKQRIKYASARKLIESALEAAAENSGMTKVDLEDLAVPTYGLNMEGISERSVGIFTAELKVNDAKQVELRWRNEKGKTQKSVPKIVKEECPGEVKALNKTSKDIQSDLIAQKTRLDRFMLSDRSWNFKIWKARYHDHPLMSHLARRLIWSFKNGVENRFGIWLNGDFVDPAGHPIKGLSDETVVRLWGPLGFDPQIVLQWRHLLDEFQIVQPIKQAHREIYVLTDAELQTRTYSNRFAAHILKQHQFNSLCKDRGWKYKLQGAFDSYNTPTLELPEWNLSAEFWVEPVADNRHTTGSGIFLYVSTDQVRFYDDKSPNEPLPLTEVPALVFSEVMRTVDLFVGVASVGNDPDWMDRGEVDGFIDYWHSFSFGDLSQSAQTRREVLRDLIPRLKIADRCQITEKFLVVRGDLRTYKIHLGSSNVQMEPNNQYLCIVQCREMNKRGRGGRLYLPFEGDQTLAVILSKAFMLAEDAKIKDRSILSQIERGRTD